MSSASIASRIDDESTTLTCDTDRGAMPVTPDLYFLGFLVSPVRTGAGHVAVINQIGAFAVIDVPGPLRRALLADLHAPGFLLGHQVHADLRVRNVGGASVRFWGENDTSSEPFGTRNQNRIDKSLVPTAKARAFTMSAAPEWPIGYVSMHVQVIYPGLTEASTKQITISKRVLVISPWVPVAGVALMLTDGLSTRQIGGVLADEGHRPKRAERFTSATIARIIKRMSVPA